jgi:hypothetical protein
VSHIGRIPAVGSLRVAPALARLAIVVAVAAVLVVITLLITTGSGAGTQSSVAPDASPYPGLSQQADQVTHPRSVPPMRIGGTAPTELPK